MAIRKRRTIVPNINYKGRLSKDGYVIIFKDKRGFPVWEHRLIMERILGRPLTKKEVVHHKNGIRNHNDPSNLEVLSWNAHAIMHNKYRGSYARHK